MPGVNVGGKRGQVIRQHVMSKSRVIRGRNHPAQSLPEVPPAQVVVKEEVKYPAVPEYCNPLLPDLHCLGNMGFEVLFLMYLHTALFCQYIYLYKTVWWYPISLPPSTTSLNFHLIDTNLTLFLSIFISRRLLWSLLWDFLRPRSDNSTGIVAWGLLCLLAGFLWILCLIIPLVKLFYDTSFLNMVVLCYPIFLWIPLTGFTGDSCINLVVSWFAITDPGKTSSADSSENGGTNKKNESGFTRLMSGSESNGILPSYAGFGNSTNPQVVAKEVKLLCQDFNSRASEIVFCSMICAYYVGLVPMFFMKSHQYYDMVWSLQHTVLVLLNSFGLLSSHLLNPQYLHVLHKCALLLGEVSATQKRDESSSISKDDENSKSAGVDSAINPLSGQSSQQDAINEAFAQNDPSKRRFYFLFNDPLRLTSWLLIVHVIIVTFQIYLLMSSSKWDHLISIALMQFFSYYVLFRTARDRIVLGKTHLLHKYLYKN